MTVHQNGNADLCDRGIMTVMGYKYSESLKYHCYDLGSVELNMGF